MFALESALNCADPATSSVVVWAFGRAVSFLVM